MKPEIKSQEMLITPEIATSWLKFNTKNRPPNAAKIKYYSEQMVAGKWELNGSTIIFGSNGVLIDGQKRLLACAQTNTPFKSFVVFGVEPNSYLTVDVGEIRRHDQSLAIEGYKSCRDRSTTLTYIDRIFSGDIAKRQNSYSNIDVIELAKLYDVDDALKIGYQVWRKIGLTKTLWAAFYYVFNIIDTEKCLEFFGGLISGEYETPVKDSCIHALREKMIRNLISKMKFPHEDACAIIILAWNRHIKGEKPGCLVWRKTGEAKQKFPEIFGLKKRSTK